MENKEIMEKLLDNDHSKAKSDSQILSDVKSWDNLPISKIRVITAKYKVYLVLLLIFICALLIEYIPNMKDRYNSRESSYNQVKSQLVLVEDQIKKAQEEEKFLNEIISNESILKDCLNGQSDEECQALPESWKYETDEWEEYDYSVPLSYLQLHSLYNVKMPVDEKKVLKNLNEYLIKEDISWNSRTRVWDILRISIWNPTPVGGSEHFFSVPVSVSIEFTEIKDLIWFLYNVEKKLIDNRWDRILYKIQTVSYDIISNDEPQITEIGMLAYYYHDERFENMEEGVLLDDVEMGENEQWSENVKNTQETESEKSFFDKIFKS